MISSLIPTCNKNETSVAVDNLWDQPENVRKSTLSPDFVLDKFMVFNNEGDIYFDSVV